MNFRKGGGVTPIQKNSLQILTPPEKKRNIDIWKEGGGSKAFGVFPKIHTIWYTRSSLMSTYICYVNTQVQSTKNKAGQTPGDVRAFVSETNSLIPALFKVWRKKDNSIKSHCPSWGRVSGERLKVLLRSKNSQQHISRQHFAKWIIIRKFHLNLKCCRNVGPGKLKFLLNIAH